MALILSQIPQFLKIFVLIRERTFMIFVFKLKHKWH